MSENQTHATYEKLTSGVEKLIADQTARYEAAVAEFGKLQAKSVEQAHAWVNTATRAVQEQIAFAEELGGEWRKAVLAATKSAAEAFSIKS